MCNLKQILLLTFACKKLPNMDVGSLTDPFCVLYHLKGKTKEKVRLGNTELIQDNLNPEFVTNLQVDYFFEENQKFLIEVYDADDHKDLMNLKKQELIGSHEFTLH